MNQIQEKKNEEVKEEDCTRFFVIIVGICMLVKTMLFCKLTIIANIPITLENICVSFAFICILLSVPMILKNKARFWSAIVINFLVSILLFLDDVYYGYASNLLSISQIFNLQYAREISVALPNLIYMRHFIYIVDIILFIVLYFTKCLKIKKRFKNTQIIGIIYTVVMIIIMVIIHNTSIKEAYKYQYNKPLQVDISSIFGYHLLDVEKNLNMKKNVRYKTTSEMMEDYNALKQKYNDNYSLQYDFTEIAKDKNVIVLQLESVQNFVVNKTINGKEITPNLNQFLKENIEFTNMQNQSYSSTSDSEFAVMNSIYPLENGTSFAQYSSNDYNDMFQNFKNQNYITTYIHGNEPSFWNRKAVYSRLQIDNLLFDDIFDKNVERINTYVSDEQVYRKIVDEMKQYDNKFFVNIIASSSHIPFNLPGLEEWYSKINIDVGRQYKDTLFGNYLESMNYADYAFGILIDELKKADLYEDTVILVYGDHAGLQMYNEEMQEFINGFEYMNDIRTQINYSNVLCGLKIPGVDSLKIDTPISKLDIKPTLTQVCGVEDEFSLGTSMFSSKDFVCINNGKIITDKYFYDGNWYYISSGEKINLDQLTEEERSKLDNYCDYMQKELDISLSIDVLNLLKK